MDVRSNLLGKSILEKNIMKALFSISLSVLAYGCAAGSPKSTGLRHESSESALLSEEKFMDRASQSADIIYEGLNVISDATNQYFIDNKGRLPPAHKNLKALLLDGGYLKEWPVVPPFALTDPDQGHFKYFRGYADVDGVGTLDDVITVMELKNEVCQDFVHRYASPDFGDTIYDIEAAGNKYPGETIGEHIKVYAVRWRSDELDRCDILWVME